MVGLFGVADQVADMLPGGYLKQFLSSLSERRKQLPSVVAEEASTAVGNIAGRQIGGALKDTMAERTKDLEARLAERFGPMPEEEAVVEAEAEG